MLDHISANHATNCPATVPVTWTSKTITNILQGGGEEVVAVCSRGMSGWD